MRRTYRYVESSIPIEGSWQVLDLAPEIMRRLLRDTSEARELGDVMTLRDPGVMEWLEERVRERRDE